MALDSPCIQVCQVDPVTSQCTGCHRSLDEIARWTRYSAAERRAVLAALAARKAAAQAKDNARS